MLLHRLLPTRALAVLVLLAACGLVSFAVWGPLGDLCVGFALTEEEHPRQVPASAVRIPGRSAAGADIQAVKGVGRFLDPAALPSSPSPPCLPRLGASEHLWMNGIYDALLRHRALPGGRLAGGFGQDHRPDNRAGLQIPGRHLLSALLRSTIRFICLYYAWVKKREPHFLRVLPGAAALVRRARSC